MKPGSNAMNSIWFLVVTLSLLTFLLRASFLLFGSKLELSSRFERIFRYVPAAILASLVGPAFVKDAGVVSYSLMNPQLLAGLLAILVAWKTKSILLTLVSGMLFLWLFKALL